MFFIKLWKWSSQKTQAAQEKHRPCLQPDSRALYEIYLYEILKFKELKRWAVWIFDVTGRCFRNRSSSVVVGVTLQALAHLFTRWVVYLHISWGSQKLVEKVTSTVHIQTEWSPTDFPGNRITNNRQTSLPISSSPYESIGQVVLFFC